MLAITEIQSRAEDHFATILRNFLEHSLAIANGVAEGEAFTWFLASEYQWEMEMAGEWLVGSPASRFSTSQKSILRDFLAGMPQVRDAIEKGQQEAARQSDRANVTDWINWQSIAGLSAWKHFSIRTAILLNRLGRPAQNDPVFAPAA